LRSLMSINRHSSKNYRTNILAQRLIRGRADERVRQASRRWIELVVISAQLSIHHDTARKYENRQHLERVCGGDYIVENRNWQGFGHRIDLGASSEQTGRSISDRYALDRTSTKRSAERVNSRTFLSVVF